MYFKDVFSHLFLYIKKGGIDDVSKAYTASKQYACYGGDA